MLKQQHITAAEDRLPVSRKVGFGIGAIVSIIGVTAVANLTMLFLNIGLKLNPVWVGVVMMLPRVWDAITDPLVGVLSDNTRSRWGRRIPYVFVGAVLVGIMYAALWMTPQTWAPIPTFTYFLVMSLAFYTAMTIYGIPHQALGLEMTDDYHERTRVFAYASFFGNVAALAPPAFYWMANRSIFENEVVGLKWVGSGVGLCLMLCGLICALVCKEGYVAEAKVQRKVTLRESFAATCKNRSFLLLLAMVVLVIVGFAMVGGFANYILIYFIYGGDKDAASFLMMINGWVWALTGIMGVFPMAWLSARIGKRKTLQVFLLMMATGNLIKIWCYNPEMPYLTILPTFMLSFGMVVLFSMFPSLLADVCNEDELISGVRREGMYSASYGWWSKLGGSLAALVAGVLLNVSKFDANLEVQTDASLFWIRCFEIGIPSLLCFISVGLMVFYPLSEERSYEVKKLLAERRKVESEIEKEMED